LLQSGANYFTEKQIGFDFGKSAESHRRWLYGKDHNLNRSDDCFTAKTLVSGMSTMVGVSSTMVFVSAIVVGSATFRRPAVRRLFYESPPKLDVRVFRYSFPWSNHNSLARQTNNFFCNRTQYAATFAGYDNDVDPKFLCHCSYSFGRLPSFNQKIHFFESPAHYANLIFQFEFGGADLASKYHPVGSVILDNR
jgi:hypothetical protein